MAMLNFIKGTFKGRIGQFVGSSWKGIEYLKSYTKPGNPRTKDQVAIRNIFQQISRIATVLNEGVLKPYTFPKPHRMTAYNRMVKINKPMFDAKVWDPSQLKIFDGSLYHPGIAHASVQSNPTCPDCECVLIQYETAYAGGEGEKAIGIVYDEASGITLYSIVNRHIGEVKVKLQPIGPFDKSKLHAYLVFSHPPLEGTGETGLVSRTVHSLVD